MTTKRNREPHGAGRTRDKGQVKYYLAVCSLSERKTAITMKSVEKRTRSRENETEAILWFILKRISTEISENDTRVHCIASSHPLSLFPNKY